MKCPVCKKQAPEGKIPDSYYGGVFNIVVGFHIGRNGKPCTGSGQRPK